MDNFFASVAQADSITSVDFDALQHALCAIQTTEEARDLLTTLIDTYYTADCSSDVCKRAILKAIFCFLRYAGSTADDANHVNLWRLTIDDYILIALFFNELSTLDDVRLVSLLTEAATLLFQQTTPLIYGHVNSDLPFNASSISSLRGELQTLRVMTEKRLTTFPAESFQRQSCTAMHIGIIDCLRALLWSLMQPLMVKSEEDEQKAEILTRQREDLSLALRQVVEGILHPLTAAVKALGSPAPGGFGEKALGSPHANSTAALSPLVLSSALRVLEEFLWCCANHATPHASLDESSPDASLVAAARFAVKCVLGLLQQYLMWQQQQSMESAAGSVVKASNAVDVLRTAGAQHAVRRLLSVVLLNVALFSPLIENAVVAAVNAFGGKVDIEDPFKLMHLREEFATASVDDHEAATREGWEAAMTSFSSPFSRLRECEQILEAPLEGEMVINNDAAGADFGELDDTALLEGGGVASGKEALLQSTVGPVSVNALLEMVLLSVRRMDIMNEQALQAFHLQGLEQMQYEAAKRAQREEIQRLRRIEQQGVENIPVERLLETFKESTAWYTNGTHLLDSESELAMTLRAAFFSLLDAYDSFSEETECRVREAQALIARSLAQLPLSMMDTALDAICVRLRKDFCQCARSKATNLPLKSAYHLAIQVLFTLFSAQAPVLERGSTAFAVWGTTNIAAGAEVQHQWQSTELQSHANFTINTENPVEWLQSTTNDNVAGAFGNKKRPREDVIEGNIGSYEQRVGVSEDGASCFFREDSIQSPCVYSSFLCRLMELVTEAELPALFLDIVLNCPRITKYAWHYIHKYYCMSTEKARCLLGMWLLKSLALKRVVYRRYAVNSLLYLASARSEYPRRLAVKQLGVLLSACGADGRRVIDENAEAQLVRHAKRQMAAIPITKPISSSFTSAVGAANNIAKEENIGSNNNNSETGDAALHHAKEMQRLADRLDQHLGPFLTLCAQQPKELLPALLVVFKECVERRNTAMMQLLAEHVDVHRMCQLLFRNDAFSFMANAMPYLRRHSKDATLLVQKIMWVISAELRLMGQASAADCERIAVALLGHARVMYDSSEIQLPYRLFSPSATGAGDSTLVLHDVRFIAPFFSLNTSEELKRVYLRSFLCFVQMQLLQQQQKQQQAVAIEAGAHAEAVSMNSEELHRFIKDVVREVLVRSPVAFGDGKPRGLSRTDLLVYLHRAPHESHAADAKTSNGKYSMSSSGAVQNESRGILDAAPSSAPNSATATATTRAAEDVSISPLTTKEVIVVLLKLTRTFDDTTTEFLYGPEEIKNAVRQMMQHTSKGVLHVPSQLMATLIFACSIHGQQPYMDLVRFIHHTVLLPLAKDATWEKDAQLWRGVLLFAELHYRECSGFLANLPDQVLIQALRARPQLQDYFSEEHGNNASFGHILGSL